jgi:TonB family protein
MATGKLISKIVATASIMSLAITPEIAAACTLSPIHRTVSNHMRDECRSALRNSKNTLAKIKSGQLSEDKLGGLVVAFDEGENGCRKNEKFVFRMLDSFYAVPERKFSSPRLLERYVSNWPETLRPAEREYAYHLTWLFDENRYSLPYNLTPEQARIFVEKPEHWNIALAKFGNSWPRDDAVFASVSDPQSPHYDREMAWKLAGFDSKHQRQRKMVAASLYTDPRFGTPDFAKAETMLPVGAQYSDYGGDPIYQQANAAWKQIANAYAQSSDPVTRDKGRMLQERLTPSSPSKWPALAHPKDGRIWLSLADWPKSVKNPFENARFGPHLLRVDDYPNRAMHKEEEGRVSIAARFGPDGKFAALEVIESSGSTTLDEAAIRSMNRRFRPRLDNQLSIDGYQGSEVRVPLIAVFWRLAFDRDDTNPNGGITRYANGELSVIALPRTQRADEPLDCGWRPFFFL